MAMVEPGSLDLDAVHLRIGGVKTTDRKGLELGNKFVVAEHFVGPDGNPIEARRFDVARMCYSLFVSPELDDRWGRHKDVLLHHDRGNTGRIVGGGVMVVKGQNAVLCGTSVQYRVEPMLIRRRMADLLLPVLRQLPDLRDVTTVQCPEIFVDINVYWLRFCQVLEKTLCEESLWLGNPLREYREEEEEYGEV